MLVKGIPKDLKAKDDDYDEEIKFYFENLEVTALKGKKLNVVQVNLCYNISEQHKIETEK